MMVDISKELLDLIMSYINGNKSSLDKYLDILNSGKATYIDADGYAVALGEITKKAFDNNVNSAVLPNGRMYYNIANSIIPTVLSSNFDNVNGYCQSVQQLFNNSKGLTFKPVEVSLNQDKVKGLVQYVSDAEEYDKIKNKFTESLINFNQSVVADNIRENADFQYKSGKVQPVIRRISTGKCCNWCSSKVGTHKYYPGMSTDIFRRHAHCRCIVEYDKGTGIYQNAHTKKVYNKSKIDIERRKEIEPPNGMSQLRRYLLSLNVKANPLKKYIIKPGEEKIIKNISGGDMTEGGSCASLSFAYVGNKAGYKVLDFRGGESQQFFSTNGNVVKIAQLKGVESYIVKHTNDFKAVNQLLPKVKKGKEYILATGEHAAIIRMSKKTKGFEYLELQSPVADENKFTLLTSAKLKSRFNAQKSYTVAGYKLEASSILIETDSLSKNEEFIKLLQFINTPKSEQMKGSRGYVK